MLHLTCAKFNATVWFSKCEMWHYEPTLGVHLWKVSSAFKTVYKRDVTRKLKFPSSSTTRGIKKKKKIYPYVINYLHPNIPWEHPKKIVLVFHNFLLAWIVKTFPFSNTNINIIIHFFSILWLLTTIIFYLQCYTQGFQLQLYKV